MPTNSATETARGGGGGGGASNSAKITSNLDAVCLDLRHALNHLRTCLARLPHSVLGPTHPHKIAIKQKADKLAFVSRLPTDSKATRSHYSLKDPARFTAFNQLIYSRLTDSRLEPGTQIIVKVPNKHFALAAVEAVIASSDTNGAVHFGYGPWTITANREDFVKAVARELVLEAKGEAELEIRRLGKDRMFQSLIDRLQGRTPFSRASLFDKWMEQVVHLIRAADAFEALHRKLEKMLDSKLGLVPAGYVPDLTHLGLLLVASNAGKPRQGADPLQSIAFQVAPLSWINIKIGTDPQAITDMLKACLRQIKSSN